MAGEQEQYQAVLDGTLDTLKYLTKNPKPSYSVEGQKFDWTQYQDHLLKRADWCREKLKELDDEDGTELFEFTVGATT